MAIISRKENESINYKQKKNSVNIKNKISCQKKNLRRNRYKLNVFSRQSYEYPEFRIKILLLLVWVLPLIPKENLENVTKDRRSKYDVPEKS